MEIYCCKGKKVILNINWIATINLWNVENEISRSVATSALGMEAVCSFDTLASTYRMYTTPNFNLFSLQVRFQSSPRHCEVFKSLTRETLGLPPWWGIRPSQYFHLLYAEVFRVSFSLFCFRLFHFFISTSLAPLSPSFHPSFQRNVLYIHLRL